MALFNHTYEIKGKHADLIRTLTSQNVLNCRNIDVVYISLALGISRGLSSKIDSKTKIESAKIDSEQMVRFNDDFEFYYRLLLLSDERYCPSAKERCDKAFRYIGTEKAEKDEIHFTQTMLGGLEFLYSQIAENTSSKKNVFNNISDFLDGCD